MKSEIINKETILKVIRDTFKLNECIVECLEEGVFKVTLKNEFILKVNKDGGILQDNTVNGVCLNTEKNKNINILIACEESQRVCIEFRKLGFNAYSCDLFSCSGGHPEWHFKQDVMEVIKNKGGILETGEEYYIDGNWDLMVAHPPCTYLSVSGAKWFYHPEDKDLPLEKRRPHPKFPNRAKDRDEGMKFFMDLMNADIPRIAVENPIGIMSTQFRKPDQIVQPYYFGDKASKSTCLWLKNLPLLEPTDMVESGEDYVFKSGRKMQKWISDAFTKTKSAEERSKLRSKTFPGLAKAIAEQWGKVFNESDNQIKDVEGYSNDK